MGRRAQKPLVQQGLGHLLRERAPRLSLVGTCLASLGAFGHAVFGGVALVTVSMAQETAERARMAALLQDVESSPAMVFAATGLLGTVLGLVVLSVGLWRTRVAPRWVPVLVGGFMGALAVMYRFGPCRNDAKWKWVSAGALVASLLWLAASGAFSYYVSHFASYDKTYGPLGTVVIFMMWLFLSAFVVLFGAELNAEAERQTKKDTTERPDKPLGQRGARAADTVGPSREDLREKRKQ